MFRIIDLPARLVGWIMPTVDGCWLWMGTTTLGYGSTRWNGRKQQAHRVVYSILKGPLIDGLVIDHLCRQRSCCNPAHLEQVTQQVNVDRGNTGIREVSKTHCPQGHPYEGGNLIVRPRTGWRDCRTCKRRSQAEWRHRKALASVAGGDT